ncbi:MAG TPA: 1,6-anhydro-N-acetylmuramyl-L-alanine amidase AmpD [Rhodocyclaceae bacterium]|nr:1,6-anhydro-N-acetylmuramyl-L-alanine amidase AmpD [Rhodocyclaceae bacterium]
MFDVLNPQGWLPGVRQIVSPNFDARPVGCVVDLVVIHAISLPPDQFGGPGIEQLFTNNLNPREHPYYESVHALRVSAHFVVRRDGSVTQFVSTVDRAWHAGVSSWRGRERCNDFSIGIELEGCDSLPFRVEQYEKLARLVRGIQSSYAIHDVVGHSDIAPGRKTDPGPFFEWPRLRALIDTLR